MLFQHNHLKKWVLCIGLSLFIAACTANTNTTTNTQVNKPVIKLVLNSWVGAELNVEVVRYFLEQKLGYKTETVALDGGAQWEALAKGDAHVTLEVWPS